MKKIERQVSESNSNSSHTHEPATPSHLLRSTSISEGATTATGENKVE